MDWDAIGALGELFGAIVVIVSVVYLAKQLKESNTQGQAQAEREWYQAWHEVVRSWGKDSESVKLFRKGINRYGELSPEQRLQFHSLFSAIPDHTDALRRMHHRGYVSDDMLESQMNVCVSFLETPGGKAYWQDVGHTFGIFSYVENRLDGSTTPITETVSFFREG